MYLESIFHNSVIKYFTTFKDTKKVKIKLLIINSYHTIYYAMHAAFQLFIKRISKEHSNKVIIRNI